MAFLDDIYVVGDRPERSGAANTAIQEELRTQASRVKTQLWNRAGVAPAGSVALTHEWPILPPLCGVGIHTSLLKSKAKILGTPLPSQLCEVPVSCAHCQA